MDIKDMTMEQVEARAEEIREAQSAEDADLEALAAEAEQLAARRSALIAEQKAAQEAVARGAGKLFDERKDNNIMTMEEVRASREYLNAYADYMKTNDATECRMILTENSLNAVENDTVIPVPTFVETIVAESLKASRIIDKARVIEAKGNVKVPVEMDAPAAVDHAEGAAPVEEEALKLFMVNMKPVTAKKLVRFTDETLDNMNGEAFLRYLYDEVARGIRKLIETNALNKIIASATAQDGPKSAAYTVASTPSIAINMRGQIKSDGELTVITTPAIYANIKASVNGSYHAYDPFDGMEVILTNNLPAGVGDAIGYVIVGDLKGLMFNFPNGREVEMKYDDKTEMAADIIRLLGRLPYAVEVVGDGYFCVASYSPSSGGGK